jgi:hypothetical protein
MRVDAMQILSARGCKAHEDDGDGISEQVKKTDNTAC